MGNYAPVPLGNSAKLKAILMLLYACMSMNLFISENSNISPPKTTLTWFCIKKVCIDISFQQEKKAFEIHLTFFEILGNFF